VFRWVEHTAELELELEAGSKEGVFAEATTALAELLGGGAGPTVTREVEVSAGDDAMLLVEWLDELIYLAETEGLVPERVVTLQLDDDRLRATLEAHEGEPRPLVKAVTLHHLELVPLDGGGWRARVVLDV
jgi:SHS2 domain-containing protein